MTTQTDRFADLLGSADAAWAVGDAHGTRAAGAAGPFRQDTPVEVGGLTAVLALWPVIGALVDEGALSLHTPLCAYWDREHPPAGTTTHQLLTGPGDGALTTLAALAEHLTGEPLADLAAVRVWRPLGMTGTTLTHTTLDDLTRFLRHLTQVGGDGASGSDSDGGAGGAGGAGAGGAAGGAGDADGAVGRGPVGRAWIADSLRIRTGELVPSRGLLWHPAPRTGPREDIWRAPAPTGPTLWLSPRRGRWAVLLTHTPGLRDAFRALAFDPA
ncbi:hypothetical protein [Streptomyces sp. NPDC090022]|uniref:hypothetical protein n=1 Tax=Streptomyces sp. NPDC090022 TaxID=3365920 RepID=UPI003803D7F9